jgi:hypothetical protein
MYNPDINPISADNDELSAADDATTEISKEDLRITQCARPLPET